eukprot:9365751-Pyramimonas_sp.AAC.1
MIPAPLQIARGASTSAPALPLDACTRALRSQHSARRWRPHCSLRIFPRSAKDSRQTTREGYAQKRRCAQAQAR